MLQNKIYQNFIKEITKNFFVILFGLTIIAWTVRAVNFLDLIVENGYSIITYFHYSFLNLFGIMTKFIPLSFLLALSIFIAKQNQENELIILWTSGVKKLKLVNLFFIISIFVLIFYLIFSVFLTPLALNKSRILLSKDKFESFLPTIRVQQFSDSFPGFTFIVEEKFNDEVKNIFIHDSSNILKGLSVSDEDSSSTTIIAKTGIVDEKKMILFNGQILTRDDKKVDKKNKKNEIVKFEQLNLDLENLETSAIKLPKLQETSTYNITKCLLGEAESSMRNCNKNSKSEIITTLNRRIVLPAYIPIISLICSFLLFKIKSKKNYFFNKYSVFCYCFIILLYSELIVRYTGISNIISFLFILSPIILMPIIYLIIILKLSREHSLINE